jgi:hypothetical protein
MTMLSEEATRGLQKAVTALTIEIEKLEKARQTLQDLLGEGEVPPRERSGPEEMKARREHLVLEMCRDGVPWKVEDLADVTPYSAAQVRTALDHDWFASVKRGFYTLSEKGRQEVARLTAGASPPTPATPAPAPG